MNKLQLELPLFEEWKTIENYDTYQVSNFGRVKSLNYNKTKQEKILKSCSDKNGYQQVSLCKDGKVNKVLVHRLVASAFIDNSNNHVEVNHIDEIKTNNHVSNLEWCTRKYNINYGNRNERHSKAMIGKNSGKDNPTSKQVIQLTLDNQIVKIWDCMNDVQRELGYNSAHISECCKGKRKTSNGYKWCYA